MQGDAAPHRPRVRAVLTDPLSGPKDRRHFARVKLTWTPDGFRAGEVRPHGSGNLRSMVHANALAILPEGTDRVDGGESVDVVMLGRPEVRT